jgi:hypothetical protein
MLDVTGPYRRPELFERSLIPSGRRSPEGVHLSGYDSGFPCGLLTSQFT